MSGLRDAVMKTAKKPIPFSFVLEELDKLGPYTKAMFGCTAVYIEDKIFLILRDKSDKDSGVWVCTEEEHHTSLRKELPSLRSISLFGPGPTKWQVLPVTAMDFETNVMKVCEMIRDRDPRIGRVPGTRKKSAKPKTKKKKKKS